jgi:YVTN family beta-propeller protein
MLPSRTRVLRCLLAAALVSSLLPVAAEAAVPRTAYVTNFGSDNLSPISVFSGTVDPVIAVGGLPRGIAITPDGTTAYVANSMSDTVTPVDTVTGTVSPAIPVGTTPEAIATDGATAYVTNANSGEVIPIDVATNMAGTPIGGLATPSAIAITPDGATAYVATESSHSVVPIDTATNTAGPPIAVGLTPRGITITPDGATAYVANSNDDTVTPIDTATNAAGPPIPVGIGPVQIAITPDGETAYVASAFDNAVTPIDTATDTPGLPIPVGNFPVGIAITPDGARAYVTNADTNSVTVIDTSSNTAGTTIPVGATPIGIAITPDQAPQAAFGATPAMAGSASSFDASASTDEDGTVASYVWDFGDGHSDTTGAPAASHTYAAPGTYTVTLTVTDNEGCSTQFVFTGQTASCNGSGVARVQHDVTVPAAAKPEPPADPVPPADPSPPAAPPPPVGGVEAAQAIERFGLASRCVRPSRAGLVRVGLKLRLVRRGPVRVQVQRAVGSGAMKSCPTPSRSRSFDGRLRGVELRRSIEPRVAAAAVSGRMTLRVRLRPGLYRITVRAYGSDAGLTQPARRWLRVLG